MKPTETIILAVRKNKLKKERDRFVYYILLSATHISIPFKVVVTQKLSKYINDRLPFNIVAKTPYKQFHDLHKYQKECNGYIYKHESLKP